MPAERDLAVLLASMEPERQPGSFVFTTGEEAPPEARAVVVVREAEGVTTVLERSQADELGLGYDFVAAMISLRVHSALDAVGLTAAIATELADHGISCNVVAGYFHDHLFVPEVDADRAVDLLRALARPDRLAPG